MVARDFQENMTQPSASKPSGGRPRLLVIGADEDVRYPVTEFLTRNSYEVEMAAGPDEALQLAQLVRWDGVIIDLDSPGLNGVELYARILRCCNGARLPVLFITSHPNPPLQFSLGHAPWARLLQKPWGLEEFLTALEQCLRAVGTTPAGRGCASGA